MSQDEIDNIDDIPEIEITEVDREQEKAENKYGNPNSADNYIEEQIPAERRNKESGKAESSKYLNNVGHEVKPNLDKHDHDKIESENKQTIEVFISGNNISTLQEDELMNKINKEAENVGDKISPQELKLFSKYDKLSEEELKQILKDKSKEILSLSKSQEKYKEDLSQLIDGLNDAIDKSQSLLVKREKNPQNMKSLEHILSVRQRELVNTKNQAKIYRQQYELLSNKANDKCSSERLNDMEEQIDMIKKENIELTKRVRTLKNTQIMQSKELEVCNKNKKYPQKINSQTEEVKNLVAKKHEYFSKLTKNKQSLSNMKIYLQRVSKMFKEVQSNPKYNTKANEATMRQVEQDLGWLSEELKGTDEEILEKILNPLQGGLNMYRAGNLLLNKGLKNSPLNNIIQSKSPTNKISYLPKNSSSPPPKYKGIFNKYEYLTKERDNIRKNTKSKSNSKGKVKSPSNEEYNFNEGNSSELLNEDIMNMDYENTTDIDYSNLIKKREQLEKINFKIEKNIREIEKLYDKKFRDLNNTIEHNQKKLKLMQQQNDLLSVEISDLSKIIKLNIEESKLKKEIKDSESKIFKSLGPNLITNAHNDVSETRNDILQELNNLLIAEGGSIGSLGNINMNKKKTMNTGDVNENENVIEEENVEGNSMLVQGNQENIENKNLKFPDISNVEVVEEENDLNRRERKLNSIKNKYISIDNEINFSERN